MSHPLNIVIAEPSVLLYYGLASVIGNSGRNVTLIRADSAAEIQRLITVKTIDAVIVNPVILHPNTRSINNFRALSPATRLIALIYAFYDDSLLSLFDERITINDPPEKILAAITVGPPGYGMTENKFDAASLTDREIEVLKLLASGMATKEIARILNISTNTVISHRKNLSSKTGIRSVSGLAVYAVVMKYITPGNTGI